MFDEILAEIDSMLDLERKVQSSMEKAKLVANNQDQELASEALVLSARAHIQVLESLRYKITLMKKSVVGEQE